MLDNIHSNEIKLFFWMSYISVFTNKKISNVPSAAMSNSATTILASKVHPDFSLRFPEKEGLEPKLNKKERYN